jgi:hypothetical protein
MPLGWPRWFTSIIPATQEAETTGSRFEAIPSKVSERSYLKYKTTTKKRLEV